MTTPVKSSPSNVVLSDLLAWSNDRPPWQRDALRRIITATGITGQDLEELEQLCRSPHGVATPSGKAPTAVPLAKEDVGHCGGAGTEAVSLIALAKPTNVNRLPEDVELTFGPCPGLTVVFGVNGAGKSGYARILKKACQSRGTPPEILPDAHLPASTGPAAAEIKARRGQTEFTHPWTDGLAAHPHLAQVFVFDSATAANYLTEDGPTTFTPFGLDILPKLSQTCDRIRERLERERSALESQCQRTAVNWGVPTSTPTAQFLTQLSAKTSALGIEQITTFTAEDEKQRAEIDATLKTDPRQKAKTTRASADRIEGFVTQAKARMVVLSAEALARVTTQVSAAVEADKAAQAFSQRQFPSDALRGTGLDVWKKLWTAAREFSESSAYQGQPFPATSDDARCVLCQQPLSREGRERFAEFQRFMANQSQRLAAETRATLEKSLAMLSREAALVPVASAIEADVGEAVAPSVHAFAAQSDSLLQAVQAHLQKREPLAEQSASFDTAPLVALVQALRERALREESAVDPAKRAEMQQKLAALQARETISRRKAEIVAHVEALKQIEKLNKCMADVATRGITLKNGELTEKLVTDAYLKQFAGVLHTLDLASITVKIVPIAGRKGETKFGLRLETTNTGATADLSAIASEGEQRCIAMAAFLAELSQASHKSALVFDDPVSSLDHNYRTRVAALLAQEAIDRQVIVFTHDLVFLHDLQAAAEERNVTLTPRAIEWDANGPGRCQEDLPWEGKRVEPRLEELERRQRDVVRACSGPPNQQQTREILDIYAHLRGTLERIIEDKILEGGLTRYQNQVKVGKLRGLVGFSQAEFDQLANLHNGCSDVIRAHDSAAAKQVSPPSPKTLGEALEATRDLLELIKRRKNPSPAPTASS
jgi:DNA repair exonuclease SbcCD ATPase subunit